MLFQRIFILCQWAKAKENDKTEIVNTQMVPVDQ